MGVTAVLAPAEAINHRRPRAHLTRVLLPLQTSGLVLRVETIAHTAPTHHIEHLIFTHKQQRLSQRRHPARTLTYVQTHNSILVLAVVHTTSSNHSSRRVTHHTLDLHTQANRLKYQTSNSRLVGTSKTLTTLLFILGASHLAITMSHGQAFRSQGAQLYTTNY